LVDRGVRVWELGGVATSCAGLLLFVGTLRDQPGVSLFVAFGLALLFTMGALVAFLIEMLLASRGLRDQADYANKVGEMHELAAEVVDEPTHADSGQA
ncbi:MAG: hypothetical protein WA447_24380, partial [Candidatus Binatus sp.]